MLSEPSLAAGPSSKSSSRDDHRMITASGKRATPITVATTLLVAVLTTETVLAILFETYAKAPSGVMATPRGSVCTAIVAVRVLLAVLITRDVVGAVIRHISGGSVRSDGDGHGGSTYRNRIHNGVGGGADHRDAIGQITS
jgi:hypothetical protein